jgi:hypothetical protein
MYRLIFLLEMKRLFYFILSLFSLIGQAHSQTPRELKSNLPPVEGWTITPEIEVFNRNNLYERINGAAPLFLENNFQEMTSMVYTQGEDYITIQAYRHATPEDAFGMYASERSTEMTFYPEIGGEAQGDEYGLYFFSGCMYVKISAGNEGENFTSAMRQIAKGFAEKIDPNAAYPPVFAKFPKQGAIPYTEAFITNNYIGHNFLKPVYTVNYEINNKKFQVFAIDAKTVENAKNILTAYFEFTKQAEPLSESKLLITDRYNGNIPAILKGQYIVGAFNEQGADFPEEIYRFLEMFFQP